MSQNFDPKKIIDFTKDYYSILGIDKDILPKKNSRQDKINSSKIIENAFRKQARVCHPDFGGNKELFLDLVRARRIIEDPILKKIYDQGYFDEFKLDDNTKLFDVDWNKIGTYRKGSPEDTVGFSLFFQISNLKEKLNIIPAFFPETEEHNYEWDWVIDNKNKLVLSLVNDESEVLRLTDGNKIDESLPFKIYICIPKSSLNLKRKNDAVYDPFGKTMINAKIEMVDYNDFNLLETTNLEDAKNYIQNKLLNDLQDFKKGNLKTQNTDTKWLSYDELKKFDMSKLNEVLNMKSFEIVENKEASNFIDEMSDKENENEQHFETDLPI